MVLRHGWMLGLGCGPRGRPRRSARRRRASPPTGKPAARDAAPPSSVTIAQTISRRRQPLAQPGTPHTLAEALAATYANQPALQAERAKLRATDENVPQALAGWRPTVVMAGTAGYGDGISRAFAWSSGGYLNAQTDRLIGTAQATLSPAASTPAARHRPTSTAPRTR